ncbi:MAG: DUF2259 domain-containing protein [Spirochaetaceae bacterium]|nr:MAG: DUF2259 domain-containing protein [Spirochaetaceae bacterium]
MHSKKALIMPVLVGLILLAAMPAYARDVATFVNLGFSEDSRTFMFGLHGVSGDTGSPYAEIVTVDVPRNQFVSGGVHRTEYPVRPGPGQDGHGALLRLLGEHQNLIVNHKINHLSQGRLLYILLNGDEPPRERLEFRDFESDSRFIVKLNQESSGSRDELRARFHIELEKSPRAGSTERFVIGLPEFDRSQVGTYRISQILASPDESSLVFVVEMKYPHATDRSISYMVETVKIR